MTCRKCRPGRLCRDCALNAQASEERKRREALRAVQPAPAVVVPKAEPEEPVGPGFDAGYNYNIGRYRPDSEPRYAQEVNIYE